eukprot:CAMPEP_0181224926 /NCGR_PEP_ID=MMETSP1096-20121128/31404_1 /TAXON_ID=156174 ORGANISM="Chrysochromulina ericina, Strain CCMP281" /NCGR_SAMPLE_ID=MMETSP1096 /ASSEMBLY_ACC=CAM_ASM_000453 /LENGTH=82 /DNA_ID=CAMNT_0023318075 /DNA_START=652 /DNA_END=901 /DNA_ORIENTATION=+
MEPTTCQVRRPRPSVEQRLVRGEGHDVFRDLRVQALHIDVLSKRHQPCQHILLNSCGMLVGGGGALHDVRSALHDRRRAHRF